MNNSSNQDEATTPSTGTPELKIKHVLILLYAAVGFIYLLYGYFFSDLSHKGFFYHFGRAVVWPLVMFPTLGQIVGGILLVAFIALVLAS